MHRTTLFLIFDIIILYVVFRGKECIDLACQTTSIWSVHLLLPSGFWFPNKLPVPGLLPGGGCPETLPAGLWFGPPGGPPGGPIFGGIPPLYIFGGIPPLCILGGIPPLCILGGIPPLWGPPYGPGWPPLPGPPGPGPRLSSIACILSAFSSSSSPTVLAEISGSLWSTFREFFSVVNTSVKAFLLSVILAGSPRVDERALFVFT